MSTPRQDVIVVSIRPELRFVLRIQARVNVLAAETMPQFIKRFNEADMPLVVVDQRDAPTLAKQAVLYMRRRKVPYRRKTILVTKTGSECNEPVCDEIVRDGLGFYLRILNSVKIGLSRKRGPRKALCQ